MELSELRRLQRRRWVWRPRLVIALAALVAAVVTFALAGFGPQGATGQARGAYAGGKLPALTPHRRRPAQFIVVSFDGSGGPKLWPYWRWIGRRADARFTFFVSGVYLLDEARRNLYRPPRHAPGASDIGFAQPEGPLSARTIVRGMLEQMALAYRAGHEIGTHFNGHFCAPYSGNVGEWNAADWRRELDQFDRLLFRVNANNRLRPPVKLPFGRAEIVGERTPCLQGNLRILNRVLARRGFRYDASRVGVLGDWPHRELGIWDIPLVMVPLVGHTYKVISMDYNFFANQTSARSVDVSEAPAIAKETYRTLWHAFQASYYGNRAPLPLGWHFERWNHWAYDHALARFLLRACRLPEVRCVSYRELADWLDAQPQQRLRLYRAGRFPHFQRFPRGRMGR